MSQSSLHFDGSPRPYSHAFLALILLVFALPTSADSTPLADLGAVSPKAKTWTDRGDRAQDGREGSETMDDAFPILSLPFDDTGATCDNVDDYGEMCPYGTWAPDVVYSYEPSGPQYLSVDLCSSLYDTALFIYEDGPGNLVACNDDGNCGYSGYQSHVDDLPISPGHVYYIDVDGYTSACGTYYLHVEASEPCTVECPPGALEEGEPPCADGYVDTYNGGCDGQGWMVIGAQAEGCATLCGRSCTYYSDGYHRDTDWFSVTAAGGPAEVTCTAEFRARLFLIYGTDCYDLQYDETTGNRCQTIGLSRDLPVGSVFWVRVQPVLIWGVPESGYTLQVCGIEEVPVPVVPGSWGRIKSSYR